MQLYELEQADVSFMPIGRAPAYESGPTDFGGERFLKRQGIDDWEISQWHGSCGIQVYTGRKTGNNALRIWANTPQNCPTTSQFFINDRRLFRNGIMVRFDEG